MMPNLLQYPVSLCCYLESRICCSKCESSLHGTAKLEHQLKDSGAKAIIIIENFAKTLERVLTRTAVKHIITTQVGDLFPFVKRTLVNTAVKYVKKMVPEWHLPGAVDFRQAHAIGHQKRL